MSLKGIFTTFLLCACCFSAMIQCEREKRDGVIEQRRIEEVRVSDSIEREFNRASY